MTGVTSGFGREAALKMAAEGAHVIPLVRNDLTAKDMYTELQARYPHAKGKLQIMHCDMTNLATILSVGRGLKAAIPHIDQLIVNAGSWYFKRQMTVDTLEETLQVNFLAPVLLTHILSPLISQDGEGRIVYTVSGPYHSSKLNFEDLETTLKYNGIKAYRQSKHALLMMSVLFADLLKKRNISVYTQHPGLTRSRLSRRGKKWVRLLFNLPGQSPARGARNLLFLMKTPNGQLQSGAFYRNRKMKRRHVQCADQEALIRLHKAARDLLDQFIAWPSPAFPPLVIPMDETPEPAPSKEAQKQDIEEKAEGKVQESPSEE